MNPSDMTSPQETPTQSATSGELPVQPGQVSKRSSMKWTAEFNVLLMNTYYRFVKKEIAHKDIRPLFAEVAHVDSAQLPQHATLMNYISHLKRLAIEAADLHEDIERYSRTPTERERNKNLLSSKQKELRKVLDGFGIAPGDTTLEHDVYKLGNDLKLHKSLSAAKKDLEVEKLAYKKKCDLLTRKILESRDYAREVRVARRKRPASALSTDNELNVEDELYDPEIDGISSRHNMAYCDPNDPPWAARRSRSSFSNAFSNDPRFDSLQDVAERTRIDAQNQRKALEEMRHAIEHLTCKSNKMERQFKRLEYRFDRFEALLCRLASDRELSQNADEYHFSDSDSLKGEE